MTTDDRPVKRSSGHHVWKVVKETVLLLGSAVVLALVVKTLFLQSFYIPSESMEPGLTLDDRIVVEKPSYWFDEPERGDVVVFQDPGGWLMGEYAEPTTLFTRTLSKIGLYPTGGHLVKRVIGVPGDVIECCDEETGRLRVNGTLLDEDAFIEPQQECDGPMVGDCGPNAWKVGPVPDGMLFVMGDNRDDSADSTVHLCGGDSTDCTDTRGYVPADLVVGKVFALAWPPGRWDVLDTPDVFSTVPASPGPAQ